MSARRHVLVFAAFLAACGGAAAPSSPARPAEPPGPEPTTVEEAQSDIDKARAELLAPPAAPPPAADAAPTTPSAGAANKASEESKTESSSCQSPCRAIASMRRAVTALCRMTGDEDNRCLDAKKTLADSETKIRPCGC